VSATPNGYISLQVGSSTCFYVSTTKIWPFPNGLSQTSEAVARCSSMGLTLATIENANEQMSLKNLSGLKTFFVVNSITFIDPSSFFDG